MVPAYMGTETDNYWVYPILSLDPQGLVERLVANGYDATRRSSLVVIDCLSQILSQMHSQKPTAGQNFLDEVVFLPLDDRMSESDMERLANLVNAFELQGREGTQTSSLDHASSPYRIEQ